MQNTLHISQIDESVMRALTHKAQEMHVSVEELVRRYLREISTKTVDANGNSIQNKNAQKFPEFGVWSDKELQEFERNTAPFREIDPDLWK
ncbi:MAG TPA: ribbon-helix-helix domain-containing protein [Candidatus Kapabacteria bacterium]|jgi:hypothetical protein|nr:ribbon-helix-helix domain-containing protein [Candidatus Kapabacteria bacterium]